MRTVLGRVQLLEARGAVQRGPVACGVEVDATRTTSAAARLRCANILTRSAAACRSAQLPELRDAYAFEPPRIALVHSDLGVPLFEQGVVGLVHEHGVGLCGIDQATREVDHRPEVVASPEHDRPSGETGPSTRQRIAPASAEDP